MIRGRGHGIKVRHVSSGCSCEEARIFSIPEAVAEAEASIERDRVMRKCCEERGAGLFYVREKKLLIGEGTCFLLAARQRARMNYVVPNCG
jgi:hypothetical protein